MTGDTRDFVPVSSYELPELSDAPVVPGSGPIQRVDMYCGMIRAMRNDRWWQLGNGSREWNRCILPKV